MLAFYNLASCYTPLFQNHTDLYNFMQNSFNNYTEAIDILLDNYNAELKIEHKKLLIFIILCVIIFLSFIILFCILIVMSFISAAKRRIIYMHVFYGINLKSIKNLMIDSEKLLKNIKKIENGNYEKDLEEELEEKKAIINKIEKSSRNMSLNNNNDIKNNSIILSLSNKIFLIFYIIIMIIEYIYFPYACIFLYKISIKSFDYLKFFNELHNFHSNIITQFNIYREYIFDDRTKIKGIIPFEFLIQLELDSYDKISEQINYIDNFINKTLKTNDEVIQFYSRDLCSFYITDYFDSEEECKIKYSYIMDYDFNILFTNFLQNLRNLKNLI